MKKRITIATGIYPPDIGGPAYYAAMLFKGFEQNGHKVFVKTYGMLGRLPTGLRHIAYFFRLIPAVIQSDVVVILDTFSAAYPTVLVAKIFGKKICMRVGGDFMWEQYVERTHKQILLSHFYKDPEVGPHTYTRKERLVFKITKYVFRQAEHIVFSTAWQRDITIPAYGIDPLKVSVIENLYDEGSRRNIVPKEKIILSPTRPIFLKNKSGLEEAVAIVQERFLDIVLDTNTSSRDDVLLRMNACYVVVVPSISEVSPNLVLEAVRFGVPVIATEDCGIKDRLGDTVLWVNTLSAQAIADAITELMDASKYSEYMSRMSHFSFVHTVGEIMEEFEQVIDKLTK